MHGDLVTIGLCVSLSLPPPFLLARNWPTKVYLHYQACVFHEHGKKRFSWEEKRRCRMSTKQYSAQSRTISARRALGVFLTLILSPPVGHFTNCTCLSR